MEFQAGVGLQEIEVQASVDTGVIEVQTMVSLPERVPALWHCQVPKTIIDMSPRQVESRVEDENDQEGDQLDSTDVGDEGEVEPMIDETLVTSDSDRVDVSREATSHPSDDGRMSRNASAAPAVSESDDGSDGTYPSRD